MIVTFNLIKYRDNMDFYQILSLVITLIGIGLSTMTMVYKVGQKFQKIEDHISNRDIHLYSKEVQENVVKSVPRKRYKSNGSKSPPK